MDISAEFLRATLRLSAPLLLASIGGSFMHHAGVPNVAMDGMMLIAGLAAFGVSVAMGSSLAGLIAAIFVAILVGLIYAFFVLGVKADVFAVGIALNIFLYGAAAYILRSYFHQDSVLVSTDVKMLPVLSFDCLGRDPTLNSLFNNYSLMIPISLMCVLLAYLIFYRTPFGYWLRAAGIKPEVLEASGQRAGKIQLASFIISGAFCGMAGAHLAIGYLGMFALAMVAGRGFIALAVVLFGRGHPVSVLIASLIFGAAEAASIRIPVETMAPQFSLMLPYILTILAVTLIGRVGRSNSESVEC
jgi:simple sugar transport system permease protein